MNKTEFLQIAQKCAMMPKRIGGIIEPLPDELKIVWKEKIYYPVERICGFDSNGNQKYYAVLHELNNNSIIRVNLNEVKTYAD